LSGARRAEKSGKQIPFLRTNLKKTFFKLKKFDLKKVFEKKNQFEKGFFQIGS